MKPATCALAGAFAVVASCTQKDRARALDPNLVPYMATDSMGAMPGTVHTIQVHARPDLVENSAVVMSDSQPGVLFTVNDSGNDAVLFALDTTGADRGAWRITNASNIDWEALSLGTCALRADSATIVERKRCIYIGDVGDNGKSRTSVTIYRIPEPLAQSPNFTGTLNAESLNIQYSDGAHDVEAMYVAPDGTLFLITKRSLKNSSGARRQSLIFKVDSPAWSAPQTAIAQLIDSLPIVPGSNSLRQITDASLSRNASMLAVRTYGQLYIFATDTISGRVQLNIHPTVCNIAQVEPEHGEGVTWFDQSKQPAKQLSNQLLLTSEGRDAPMQVVSCPLPSH